MIYFRRKNFSKASKLFRKYRDPITVASVGVSGVNLGINLKRGKNEKKFQKEQIQATNNLTRAIEDSENEKKELLKHKKKLLNKSQKAYVRDNYLPPEIEVIKTKVIKKHD